MFRIHYTNLGYSRHADTYAAALKMGKDSGFEFTIWSRENTQLAAFSIFGGLREKK